MSTSGLSSPSPSPSPNALYSTCASQNNNEGTDILFCVTKSIEDHREALEQERMTWMLLLCSALVFFMQAGFAALCAGCVQKKNVQNTMLKNLLDASGSAVIAMLDRPFLNFTLYLDCCMVWLCKAFYSVGYAFAYGGQDDRDDVTVIGIDNFFNTGQVDLAFWFCQYTFAAASVTIVAGTLAERCQMTAYLCYSLFLTGFVYPVVAHTVWSNNGFLSAFAANPRGGVGAIDFSGSGVVHLTGGTTALISTCILGPRKGRFHHKETGELLDKPKPFRGHSHALQILGTLMLWFGWYGFNPGSALLLPQAISTSRVAALAAVNTTLSGGAGGISALMFTALNEYRKNGVPQWNLQHVMNGALSGLVAITAACGTVENWAAVCIGFLAGLLYLAGSHLIVWCRLDDAVDAIPVHWFGGSWGLIATGLLSSPDRVGDAFGSTAAQHAGWFYDIQDATLLGNNCLCLAFIFGWTAVTMTPFFLWVNYMGWLRVHSIEELVGLDLAYHQHEPGQEDLADAIAEATLERLEREKDKADQEDRKNSRRASTATGTKNSSETSQPA